MTPDEHPHSPCYDDLRFISTNPNDVAAALAICGTCTDRACKPILADLLSTPTGAAYIEGTWDGQFYSDSRRQPIKHGRPHSARAHRVRGEVPCQECREAENAYQRQYREGRAS
jgi:hypothetical protein